jgi:CRISPR-associated protein Cas2
MRKKHTEKYSFVDRMLMLKRAGITHRGSTKSMSTQMFNELDPLEIRIQRIFEINSRTHLSADTMLYFIMYDIENNKVRNQIAKYLTKKGCLRVQKSIFFADTERSVFDSIHRDLRTIQELYDNHDSIFFVPVSTDQVKTMKIIGHSIDFELITGSKNTLFF